MEASKIAGDILKELLDMSDTFIEAHELAKKNSESSKKEGSDKKKPKGKEKEKDPKKAELEKDPSKSVVASKQSFEKFKLMQ